MGRALTIRLNEELAVWVEETSKRTGLSPGQIVRAQLERARSEDKSRRFMRLAGTVKGPKNLSARKGFSKE